MKNPSRTITNSVKLGKTMEKKQNLLHSRVEQVVRFSKMMTCGDDNLCKMVMILFLWILIHKNKCRSKTRQNWPLGCFAEKLLKNQSSKIYRHSQVSLDRCLSTRPGRQAIQSNCFITISIHYHIPRGGGKGRGVATERCGRGSQVWILSQIPTVNRT